MIEEKKELRDLVRFNTASLKSYPFTRLDKCERVLPFPESFVEKIREVITPELIMAYPTLIEELQEDLARWLGVNPQQVVLSSGSDIGIKYIFETFIGKGDKVILNKPGFAMYSVYANMFGASIVENEYHEDFTLDFEGLKEKMSPDAKMVVLENPNGFIGTVSNKDSLLEIIELAQKNNTLAVVDEAYFHFHDETCLPEVDRFDNLVVTRTFSKGLGLAGLRLGYLITNPDLASKITKVKTPFEVTGVSAAIGKLVLENPEFFQEYLDMVKSNRPYFLEKLAGIGVEARETQTNFIVLKLPTDKDSSLIEERLRQKGILVRRPFAESFLQNWMRVGIGTKEHIDHFVQELDALT